MELEQLRESERCGIRTTSMPETVLARERRRASCAGAETAKDHWRAPYIILVKGKIDPERETRQGRLVFKELSAR